MSDLNYSHPRLNNDASNRESYAPISWTAVGSLAVAGLFLVLILVFAFTAYKERRSLQVQELLVFPAISVVLAIVARRQIHASEGTRTGEIYANSAWWISVVTGLTYLSYLLAKDFTVRKEASVEFVKWTDNLRKIDPTKADDPATFAAFYKLHNPGKVADLSPDDREGLAQRFSEELIAFRRSDLYKVCARNHPKNENDPAATFKWIGMRSLQHKPQGVECKVAGLLTSVEGEMEVEFDIYGTFEAGVRAWHIRAPESNNYITSKKLTRYGRLIEALEGSAIGFSDQFLRVMSVQNAKIVEFAFDPNPSTEKIEVSDYAKQVSAVSILAGTHVLAPKMTKPETFVKETILVRPDGKSPQEIDIGRFQHLWSRMGAIGLGGSLVAANHDDHRLLSLHDDRIEFHAGIDMNFGVDRKSKSFARGQFVARVNASAIPKLMEALKEAKNGKNSAITREEYEELFGKQLPWRASKIISDMNLIKPPSEPKVGPDGQPMPE